MAAILIKTCRGDATAQRRMPQKMGFDVKLKNEKCNGCEDCLEACTADVFEMRNGKAFPANADACQGCESCIEVCREEAIKVEDTRMQLSPTCEALLKNIL